VEGAERSGGLHKRSAEDWGASCIAPGTESIRRSGGLVGRGAQAIYLLLLLGVGVAGGKGPRSWVSEDGAAGRSREEASVRLEAV